MSHVSELKAWLSLIPLAQQGKAAAQITDALAQAQKWDEYELFGLLELEYLANIGLPSGG